MRGTYNIVDHCSQQRFCSISDTHWHWLQLLVTFQLWTFCRLWLINTLQTHSNSHTSSQQDHHHHHHNHCWFSLISLRFQLLQVRRSIPKANVWDLWSRYFTSRMTFPSPNQQQQSINEIKTQYTLHNIRTYEMGACKTIEENSRIFSVIQKS